MYCTNCGAPLSDSSARFCTQCGAPVNRENEAPLEFSVSVTPDPVVPAQKEETSVNREKPAHLSFLFGLLGLPTLFVFLGPIFDLAALILGFYGLKSSSKTKAIFGILLAGIGLILFGLWFAFLCSKSLAVSAALSDALSYSLYE